VVYAAVSSGTSGAFRFCFGRAAGLGRPLEEG